MTTVYSGLSEKVIDPAIKDDKKFDTVDEEENGKKKGNDKYVGYDCDGGVQEYETEKAIDIYNCMEPIKNNVQDTYQNKEKALDEDNDYALDKEDKEKEEEKDMDMDMNKGQDMDNDMDKRKDIDKEEEINLHENVENDKQKDVNVNTDNDEETVIDKEVDVVVDEAAASKPETQEGAPPYLNDLTIKHPLQHSWTLWHWTNDNSKSWSDMLNEVVSFNTVEDFFSVYYYIKLPTQLKPFNDYMVFKHGIRPMWEDHANRDGGRWILVLEKSPRNFVDNTWLELLLCIIGECFEESAHICGAVINVRSKANKISMWTRDANDNHAVLSLGKKLKMLLNLKDIKIHYQLHKDVMIQHGPHANSIHVL